jgi:hypothetical protein
MSRKRKASKKEKSKETFESTPALCPSKTKTLESSEKKRKVSEGTSEVELDASSSLADLGKNKSMKAVKKVSITVVRRVSKAFSDDEAEDEPCRPCYFPCICCRLRLGFCSACTPTSENEFVDIETFSDARPEAQAAPKDPVTIATLLMDKTRIYL